MKDEIEKLQVSEFELKGGDGDYITFENSDELAKAYAFIKDNAAFIIDDGMTGILVTSSGLLSRIEDGTLALQCDTEGEEE